MEVAVVMNIRINWLKSTRSPYIRIGCSADVRTPPRNPSIGNSFIPFARYHSDICCNLDNLFDKLHIITLSQYWTPLHTHTHTPNLLSELWKKCSFSSRSVSLYWAGARARRHSSSGRRFYAALFSTFAPSSGRSISTGFPNSSSISGSASCVVVRAASFSVFLNQFNAQRAFYHLNFSSSLARSFTRAAVRPRPNLCAPTERTNFFVVALPLCAVLLSSPASHT